MAFNVKDAPFNAVGDGIFDDTLAIQAAIDAAAANNRGAKVIIPEGIYLTTAQLNVDGLGITIEGEGAGDKAAPFGIGPMGPTTILASHTSGAGIRIWQRNCTLKGLQVNSTDGRKAAALSVINAGVRVEPIDVSNARVDGTLIDDVYCIGHPGDGILFSGGEMVGSAIVRSGATASAAHGIVIDGGDRTGRTDKSRPGIMEILHCRASRCHGNALVIGSPSTDAPGLASLPYRVHIQNLECFRLGDVGGPRYGAQCVWVFGENIVFDQCAFGGTDIDGVNGHLAGIYAAGRDIRINDCRYIQTNRGVSVGQRTNLGTKDLIINGASVSQDTAALNPFCVVTAGAKGVKIRAHATSEVASWGTASAGVLDLDIVT
jgi:hypothetical protein